MKNKITALLLGTALTLAKSDIAKNAPLKLYRDPGYKFSFAIEPRARGFPTTIIYDRQGRERAGIGRDVGTAFEDHRDDAERRRDALEAQAVGLRPGREHAPERIGQGGDAGDGLGH
eukprot:gene33072-44262_t